MSTETETDEPNEDLPPFKESPLDQEVVIVTGNKYYDTYSIETGSPPYLPVDHQYPIGEEVVVPKPPKKPPGPSRRTIKPKEWEQAVEMYRNGIGWADIGRTLGINGATMAKKACVLGITRRRKEVAAAKIAIIKEAHTDRKQTLEAMGEVAKQRLAEDVIGTMDRVDTYSVANLDDEGKREQVVASVVKRSSAIFGWRGDEGAPAAINVAILNAMPDIQRDGG